MTFYLVRTARVGDCRALRVIHAHSSNGVSVPGDNDPDICGLLASTRGHYPFLVAERNGVIVGFAYARAHKAPLALRWSADVTVYMTNEGRRAGLLHSLYRSLLDHLKAQGYLAVYTGLSMTDPEVIASHEALGFVHIGLPQALDLQRDTEYWCLTLAANMAPAPGYGTAQRPAAFAMF